MATIRANSPVHILTFTNLKFCIDVTQNLHQKSSLKHNKQTQFGQNCKPVSIKVCSKQEKISIDESDTYDDCTRILKSFKWSN